MQGNNTEYKSVTVANDATAEEFMDFYLDDPTRPKWVRSLLSLYRQYHLHVGHKLHMGPSSACLDGVPHEPQSCLVSASVWCWGSFPGNLEQLQRHVVQWCVRGDVRWSGREACVRAQDSMISETEVLENGDGKHRCQVVRWMRTFPFSFISKREYVIARRMWRGADGALYGITKARTSP